MGISDHITEFIIAALKSSGGVLELRRQELADRFGCVPSQINYVVKTRFSPEHGFIVESRRGGGGYIRISRVRISGGALVMHTVNTIGMRVDTNSLTAILNNLHEAGILTENELALLLAATSDQALIEVPPEVRPGIRASIAKRALVSLLK